MLHAIKKPIKYIVVITVLLVLLLCTTEPSRLPSIALIVPFALLFALLMTVFGVLLGLYRGSLSSKELRAGAFAAILPTLLLLLQSIGQLTLRDAAILVILFTVGYFYLTKMRAAARS